MHRPNFIILKDEATSVWLSSRPRIGKSGYEWTVTADCVLSKCGWTPMEGQKFHTRVEKTFVNGDLVYSDNKVDQSHRGQELRFKR